MGIFTKKMGTFTKKMGLNGRIWVKSGRKWGVFLMEENGLKWKNIG